jgi:hypothetical protein
MDLGPLAWYVHSMNIPYLYGLTWSPQAPKFFLHFFLFFSKINGPSKKIAKLISTTATVVGHGGRGTICF